MFVICSNKCTYVEELLVWKPSYFWVWSGEIITTNMDFSPNSNDSTHSWNLSILNEKSGYIFQGWKVVEDEQPVGDLITTATTTVTADTKFKAIFETAYAITYDYDGATVQTEGTTSTTSFIQYRECN